MNRLPDIEDGPIVMTLDAGGTNFVFSAIRSFREIVPPLTCPSHGTDLDACLGSIVRGFREVRAKLPAAPAAISFAFPGPADYPRGIIGDLANLPAFRGGVALGPMLSGIFEVPVFINNDGDLFVYGEASCGFLPWVNSQLEEAGSPKRFSNLFGVTLGTGFGAGLVRKGELYLGDNSNGTEIWLVRNKAMPKCFAEEGISIRAIQRVYKENAGIAGDENLSPEDIYHIAGGSRKGNRQAALFAFESMAEVLGDALANAITLLDGIIVIGGGLSGSYDLFISRLLEEMNGSMENIAGAPIPRLVQKVFDLEDPAQMNEFILGEKKEIMIPGSQDSLVYDPFKRTGIGLSRLGTSKAISLGAYAFALNELNKM